MRTVFKKAILDKDEASSLYYIIQESLPWQEGIRSRKGFTRLACPLYSMEFPLIDDILKKACKELSIYSNFHGIYVNYYKDGNMWTPNHSHPNTKQIVISLGATRNLKINSKIYSMESGDAIAFGHGIHGVMMQPDIKMGRISIAAFFD